MLCGFVSTTGAACAFGEVTPGWENVCPDRSEFPSATPIWTAERANAEVPSAEDPPQAFSARLEGADEMPGLTYVHRVTTAPRKTERPVHNYLRIRRYVFRAARRRKSTGGK